jgi:hypothetical protein
VHIRIRPVRHAHAPSRVSRERHPLCIATERSNVISQPLDRQSLIPQPRILLINRRRVRKAKDINAIVDGDENDLVLLPHQRFAIVLRQPIRTRREPAAIDENHDRQPLLLLRRPRRRPDVERKHILGLRCAGCAISEGGFVGELIAAGGGAVAVQHGGIVGGCVWLGR